MVAYQIRNRHVLRLTADAVGRHDLRPGRHSEIQGDDYIQHRGVKHVGRSRKDDGDVGNYSLGEVWQIVVHPIGFLRANCQVI